MTYSLDFEINKLPKLSSNGGFGTWKADHGRRKTWQRLVGQQLFGKRPFFPLKKAIATFTRYSSVQPDFDNLCASWKPVQDALVFFGVLVDDRPSCLSASYEWHPAKRGQGKIRVQLFESSALHPEGRAEGERREP